MSDMTMPRTTMNSPALLGFTRAQAGAFLIMLAALIAAPFVVYPIFVMQVMCYALFALGANLIMGYTGLLSLGQAAFFGMGSYVAGYCLQTLHFDAISSLILGGLTGAALGVIFGWLAIRRQTIYFAMITLALAQIVVFYAVENTSFTGGENGIQNIPRNNLLGVIPLRHDLQVYWFVLLVFILGFLFVHRTIHSPFGQVVKAIRENENRTISLGYKAYQYKWIMFVLAAFISGIAGALNTLVMGIATLSGVGNETSGLVVLMVLVGGIGTVFGPLIGALVIIAMQYYLASFADWVIVIQGVIFIACVLLFRRGVMGELAAFTKTAL